MKKQLKALIIEDRDSKLEEALSVLNAHGISDYVHFNNFQEAFKFIRRGNIEEIDLIILDLFFYDCRPMIGERNLPSNKAGAKFLYQMLKQKLKKPLIVFSDEEDYMNNLNAYMFPKLSEYAAGFKNSIRPMSLYEIENRHNSDMEKNRELLLDLDFVVGHAHNVAELDTCLGFALDWITAED